MKKRKLTKREVTAEPFRIWNAFIDVLAMEHYRDLDSVQRPAHLVFWYESEVQNGGHLQYFENRGTKRFAETVKALGLLGANCQQKILKQAGELFLNKERPRIKTAKGFSTAALNGEFSTFDSKFAACSPSLQECLQKYLGFHQKRPLNNPPQ